MKKTVLESLKNFLQMYKIFFPISFSLSIENEKKKRTLPFAPNFGGVLVPPASLKFGTLCPHTWRHFLSKKQKFDNFDHFRQDDHFRLKLCHQTYFARSRANRFT